MATKTTLPLTTYVRAIQLSKLMDNEQLHAVIRSLVEEHGQQSVVTPLLSDTLLEKGLVTEWQNNKLLQGKHKGFFLGKYKLMRHIGSGGMSSVYLAEHLLMRRKVAIKVLPVNRVNDSSYLERFLLEARAVASLDHPNIIQAYGVDNEGKVHYIVMEYVEGEDLEVKLKSDGIFSFTDAADYIRQAANGLAHAHERKLIHRDIKPSNLLLDRQNVIKILDLGLARITGTGERSITEVHDEKVLGTTDYLSPEQALDSHNIDNRADLYSLGCTLYFLLTGHPPFPEGTLAQRLMAHVMKEPKSILEERPDTPQELVAICHEMMRKKPDERIQTAQEVSDLLTEWLREQGVEPTSSSVTRSMNRSGATIKIKKDSESTISVASAGNEDSEVSSPSEGTDEEASLSDFITQVAQEQEEHSVADRVRNASTSVINSTPFAKVGSSSKISNTKLNQSSLNQSTKESPQETSNQNTASNTQKYVGIGLLGLGVLVLLGVGGFFLMESQSGTKGKDGSSNSGGYSLASSFGFKQAEPKFFEYTRFPIGNSYELEFSPESPGNFQLDLQINDASHGQLAQVSLNGSTIANNLDVGEAQGGKQQIFNLESHQLLPENNKLLVEVFSPENNRKSPDWLGRYEPWHSIGPFDNQNKKGYGTAFPPEETIDLKANYQGKGGQTVAWKRQNFPIGKSIDMKDKFGSGKGNNEWITFYLYRKIHAKRKLKTHLYFSSDDTLTIWLNDKKVHEFKEDRGVSPYSDKVEVTLEKGANELLLKVTQLHGGLGFFYDDISPLDYQSDGVFRFGLQITPKN